MAQFDNIKASKLKVRWSLCEIHRVIQWKSGCIYRTKSLGIISCSPQYVEMLRRDKNIIVGPVSTTITRLING